jgi:Holliday junction resolvase RusA-like endonuclease
MKGFDEADAVRRSEAKKKDLNFHMSKDEKPMKYRVRDVGRLAIMPGTIFITYNGKPIGKPRMTRSDKWKQRPCVLRYRQFADDLRLAAGGNKLNPENIQSLSWVAYFEPKEKSKKKVKIGELHRQKPDRDNIDKAILDALFKDDSAIAHGTLEKRWGSPERIEIRIDLI